ncbi:PRD domain-containing protein [Breznakia pachnodae]|uniref:Beta-glucoside operon transcriptional antiterminator n=1 Tax=Breznakia pachnodae TaxID=265178 RepID=A0ABU0E127_9FIRM|nr:PRD domain-containing protein [Breznakia pachnodae]MDQ0360428.1 beta-glucoside operon transcriptional antiterminator [Breznakia pachnodae]
MKIIRKINTSAAIALDSNGEEIVVIGKGIGFPPVPYELTDLSKIERTFYDVNSRYFGVIGTLPQPIIIASAEIVEMAEMELGSNLNPSLPFTLADHLNFAVERLRKGMNLTNAIAYDIRHFYPNEVKIGDKALIILKERANITLPENEAINIALHLINAESNVDDINAVMKTTKILDEIEGIVKKCLNIQIDNQTYEYSRFIAHLRYLIQRLSTDKHAEVKNRMMLATLAKEYPEIQRCANEVASYLEGTWGWKCNDDEILYLMLHINRIKQ